MLRIQFLRPLLVLTLGLCLFSLPSAQAQQGSDVSGALPLSDISGVLTQSDRSYLETEIVQYRMSKTAGALARALERGVLDVNVEHDPVSISPGTSILFLERGTQDVELARQHYVQILTARGLPEARAQSLGRAVSGLLRGSDVESGQFLQALQAFNNAAEAAPEAFRAHPPGEFLLTRTVLRTLLQAVSG